MDYHLFKKKNIKSKIKPFIAGIITFEVMKAGYGCNIDLNVKISPITGK